MDAEVIEMTPNEPEQSVRWIRLQMNLSQAAFADLFDVSPQLVAHWEAGRRRVPPATADAIEEKTGYRLGPDYISQSRAGVLVGPRRRATDQQEAEAVETTPEPTYSPRLIRQMQDLSADDMAVLLDVSAAYVRMMENGSRMVSQVMAQKYRDLTGLTVSPTYCSAPRVVLPNTEVAHRKQALVDFIRACPDDLVDELYRRVLGHG